MECNCKLGMGGHTCNRPSAKEKAKAEREAKRKAFKQFLDSRKKK